MGDGNVRKRFEAKSRWRPERDTGFPRPSESRTKLPTQKFPAQKPGRRKKIVVREEVSLETMVDELLLSKMSMRKILMMSISAYDYEIANGNRINFYDNLRVVMTLRTEEDRICAVVYDILKNTRICRADLKKSGVDQIHIDIGNLLLNSSNLSHKDYIDSVMNNETARLIKISELKRDCTIAKRQGEEISEKARNTYLRNQKDLAYLLGEYDEESCRRKYNIFHGS